jgi:hypothetical protein
MGAWALSTSGRVAEAVVWLCGDTATRVSGLSMVVDGGAVNR